MNDNKTSILQRTNDTDVSNYKHNFLRGYDRKKHSAVILKYLISIFK